MILNKKTNYCYSNPRNEIKGFEHETNDCTVRALTHATNLPYSKCHEIAKKAGRIDKQGGYLYDILCWAVREVNGLKFISMHPKRNYNKRMGYPTTNQVLSDEKFRKGTYIFRKNGHCFAVRDGVILDTFFQKRARITNIYKVEFNNE